MFYTTAVICYRVVLGGYPFWRVFGRLSRNTAVTRIRATIPGAFQGTTDGACLGAGGPIVVPLLAI